jgi:hypothetical protein
MPLKKYNEIKDQLAKENPHAILYDGYDDALVSVAYRFNMQPIACYDMQKCIKILMKRDKATYEEAVEYFEFNTMGMWAGEFTPIFINHYE